MSIEKKRIWRKCSILIMAVLLIAASCLAGCGNRHKADPGGQKDASSEEPKPTEDPVMPSAEPELTEDPVMPSPEPELTEDPVTPGAEAGLTEDLNAEDG